MKDLETFAKYPCFQQFVTDMALYGARQVFDVVKLTPAEQLPAALRRGHQLLQSRQFAFCEYTLVLKEWLPSRLHQMLARWAVVSDVAPTESSGLPSPHSVQPDSPKGRTPSWQRAEWWLDMLRLAAMQGLFTQAMLQEFFNELAPRFEREGIRFASSPHQAAMAVMARMNVDTSTIQDIGSQFSPLALARELQARPSMVRFIPGASLILFGCPADSNGALNFSEPVAIDDIARKHRNSGGRATSVPAVRRRGTS